MRVERPHRCPFSAFSVASLPSNTKYYGNFAAFEAAISTCFADAPTKHKAELDSLLTLRFQTFSRAEIQAA